MTLDVSDDGYLTLKVPTKTSEHAIMDYMKSQSKFLLSLHERPSKSSIHLKSKIIS